MNAQPLVVFDISTTSFSNWTPSILGVASLVVCVVVLANAREARTKILAPIWLVFALAVAIVGQWGTLAEFANFQSRYQRGDFESVEGIVTNFEPGSGAGNVPERFDVSGVSFEISSPMSTAAYHQTSRSGGPNLAGRCVRIRYTSYGIPDDEQTAFDRAILWLGILPRAACSIPDREAALEAAAPR